MTNPKLFTFLITLSFLISAAHSNVAYAMEGSPNPWEGDEGTSLFDLDESFFEGLPHYEDEPKTPEGKGTAMTSPPGSLFTPPGLLTPLEAQHERNEQVLKKLFHRIPDYFQEILVTEFAQHERFLRELGITDPDSYLEQLSEDPDHTVNGQKEEVTEDNYNRVNEKVKGILEALAGLEAVKTKKLKGPLWRGPKGIEFFADGRPIDVKTSLTEWGNTLKENAETNPRAKKLAEDLGASIVKQLKAEFANPMTKEDCNVLVLFDVTFLTKERAKLLELEIWNALGFIPNLKNREKRTRFMKTNIIKVDLFDHLGLEGPREERLEPRGLFLN